VRPAADSITEAYAPRRKVLDQILVEAAVRAGAEVREHFAVQAIVSDGDRVMGIRGHAIGGAMVSEQARIVIGADGMRSLVGRSVQAPTYKVMPALSCAFCTYWSDVAVEDIEVYARPGRMITAAPTNDGQTITSIYWPKAAFWEIHAAIAGAFMQALDLAPGLAARVRSGTRTERFLGTADLPFFFRKPYGPSWALAGDDGYLKDPITGQGVTDAFRDAELLAKAIYEGLSGRRPLEEALAEYERRRNEASMPLYELTCEFAKAEPSSPEQQQLFAALRYDQEQPNRLFGTITGTAPIAEFFAPENIGQITGAGAQVAAS
jgi:flavin-dependent dehydrogenase